MQDQNELIKGWEGLRTEAYNDSEGYCTIGYGHLIAEDKCKNITLPDEFNYGITQERANELFEERLPSYVNGVRSSVSVKLYQYEFDALVCLLFNIGASGLRLRAPMLRNKLNQEDYEGAVQEFLDITNSDNPGLVARRISENNLFLNNIYDSSH
jgi:GH24 family phage-related lysozyme (muramidase)